MPGSSSQVDFRSPGVSAVGSECKRDYADPCLAEVSVFESYEGERNEHGFYHGKGTAGLQGNHKYAGDFCNGYMHGKGVLTLSDIGRHGTPVTYTGDFVSGRPTGQGDILWHGNSQYIGDVVNGIRHGKGEMYHDPAKTHYAGSWKEGIREGEGTMASDTGDDRPQKYTGSFSKNKRHGHGHMQHSSGNEYVGEWVEGVRHGKGKFSWSNQNVSIAGNWVNGVLQGPGILEWTETATPQYPVQARYVGDFVDGKRHGHGQLCYSNGAIYTGSWKNNKKHGEGSFQTPNGVVFSGEFQNDVFVERLPPGAARTMLEKATCGSEPSHFGGGAQDSDVTPLCYLLGDIDEPDCQHISVNKTYNYRIKELMEATHQDDIREHLIEVHTVLLQSINHLKAMYDYYSCLGRSEEEIRLSHVIRRHQLWILAHDCRLDHHSLSLADVDRIVNDGTCPVDKLHSYEVSLALNDFLVWLTRIANAMYGQDNEVTCSRFPLAASLDKFLTTSLHPGAGNHRGFLYTEKGLLESCQPHMKLCHQIFCKLRSMPSPSSMTYATLEGEEELPTARHFMMMLKIYGLMGNGITVDIASSAILAGDPGAVSRGRKLNMEVEISFYQFMNAMATCAFHYCDIGETSGQAAAASPDVQLQTTAIERYIHLFQNRTVQPVSSNFSLDAPSSSPSRLSMTPSQTGVSHTSLTGASVAAKHAGSSVVVDSPMPELAESTLTPISTRATCTPCPPAGEELTASDSQLSAADESGSMEYTAEEVAEEDEDDVYVEANGEEPATNLRQRISFFFEDKVTPAHNRWLAQL